MNSENSQQTLGFQYKFSILFEKVVINIGVPCKLSVIIKRGQQKIKLLNSPVIDPVQKCCYFEEIIDLKTNVYWDTFNEIFWDKKISFTLVIESQNGNKLAGISNYNLATFLNSKQNTVYEVLKLNKCPDANAKLFVKFDQVLIKELGQVDQISSRNSIISDSIDDFHDITFQSSGNNNRSVLQDRSHASVDANQTNSVKFESNNYISFNQNSNHNQIINQQSNHFRKQSNEIQRLIYDKSSELLINNNTTTSAQKLAERKVNDENENYQMQKTNQNIQTAGLNDCQKLFILESHMKTMISEKDALKQEIKLLNQTISIKNDNLSKKTEECSEYYQRYEEIKNQRDDIKGKLDEMKRETEKIENQVLGKIELMREDFCHQLCLKQKEVDYLTNQNKNLNQKVTELISDNKTCSERLLKHENTIKEYQDALDKVNFQSTKINHNIDTNIMQMTEEIYDLSEVIKSQKETILRLEYNKKRKDEDISKFITEIHDLKSANLTIQQQNDQLSQQIQQLKRQEEFMQNDIDQDQFISFLDKPSQIGHQNNQSLHMRSYMSSTKNEFHSCIVQDFEEENQKNGDCFLPTGINQQNTSFKPSQNDNQNISRNILQEIKEENSFEKQMKNYKKINEEYSMQKGQNKQSCSQLINQNDQQSSLSQQDLQYQQKQQSTQANSTALSTHCTDNRQSQSEKNIINKEDDMHEILLRYQSIEQEYIDGKMKWDKIDKDNDSLKCQMNILNQKFLKMENQLQESKKGLCDALILALKTGDEELVNKLEKSIRQ